MILVAAPLAQAQSFDAVFYDPARDELVADLVYEGSHPGHAFSLQWGECGGAQPPYDIEARVIDQHWDDIAEREFRVRRRFGLRELECRPVNVTLRIGRFATATAFVP